MWVLIRAMFLFSNHLSIGYWQRVFWFEVKWYTFGLMVSNLNIFLRKYKSYNIYSFYLYTNQGAGKNPILLSQQPLAVWPLPQRSGGNVGPWWNWKTEGAFCHLDEVERFFSWRLMPLSLFFFCWVTFVMSKDAVDFWGVFCFCGERGRGGTSNE